MIRSVLLATLAVSAATGVAACGSSDSNASAGGAPTAPLSAGSTSTAPQIKSTGATGPAVTITPHVTPSATARVGLANSTQLLECDKTSGPVKASGTLTLPSDSGASVAEVTVSWINAADGNQLASATQTLRGLTPGHSAAWHVSANLPKTSATLTCAVHSVVPGS